jgi:SAM-dependent methyltransferase
MPNFIASTAVQLRRVLGQEPRNNAAPLQPNVVGAIDKIGSNYVNGWAYDPKGSPAVVEVFLEGNLIAKGLANDFREDLVRVSSEQQGHCAFRVLVPIKLDEIHDLSGLSVKANGIFLPFATEVVIPLPPQPDSNLQPNVVGIIDEIGSNYVNGWAYDSKRSPAVIEVFIDGNLIAKGLANDFREDLVRVSSEQQGHCAFHVLVPVKLDEIYDLSSLSVKANGIFLSSSSALPPRPDSSLKANEFPPIDIDVPDAELVFLVNGHRNVGEYSAGRRATALSIRDMLNENFISLDSFASILDFGCGCGRILAGWQHMLPPTTQVYGVDVNERLVAFCRENIAFAKCSVSSYLPPLNFDAGAFDFIYAASVFTHLTEEAATAWADEFSRLVRPTGIAMVSYHGSYFARSLAKLAKAGSVLLEERGIYVHQHDEDRDVWHGHNNYATFMTSLYVRSLFRKFELVKIYPGISHGPNPFASFQDIMILRRT